MKSNVIKWNQCSEQAANRQAGTGCFSIEFNWTNSQNDNEKLFYIIWLSALRRSHNIQHNTTWHSAAQAGTAHAPDAHTHTHNYIYTTHPTHTQAPNTSELIKTFMQINWHGMSCRIGGQSTSLSPSLSPLPIPLSPPLYLPYPLVLYLALPPRSTWTFAQIKHGVELFTDRSIDKLISTAYIPCKFKENSIQVEELKSTWIA